MWSRKQAGYPFTEEDIDARPSARHPLVHVHKGSGRKALFIAAHARDIVRRASVMPPDELAYAQQRLEWLADEVWRAATGQEPSR